MPGLGTPVRTRGSATRHPSAQLFRARGGCTVRPMNSAFDHLPGGLKLAIDLTSLATLVGTLASILPTMASALTVIWMTIRICQEPLVKGWFRRRTPR